MMHMTQLTDKATILRFLLTDPYLHLYGIGDLDDFYWPKTKWYSLQECGVTVAIFLVYHDGDLPILLALEKNNTDAAKTLLRQILSLMPSKFYCHLSPYLLEVLAETCTFDSHGLYHKMRLTNLVQPKTDAKELSNYVFRFLTPSDVGLAHKLYKKSYPGNWFNDKMLHSGKYAGAFIEEDLIAIAGVHVYSQDFRVAALGNITTHPNHRGRGIAQSLTKFLCEDLTKSVDKIGCNVKADNQAAIKCYENLGFIPHASYEEAMVAVMI